MGIVKDRGWYYWVKRVPKRFSGLVLGANGLPVSQVRQALHTDSLSEAKAKAIKIEASRLAEWEAIAASDHASARAHYEAAKELAHARGYAYRPTASLIAGDSDQLLKRILAVTGDNLSSKAAAQAVLGTIPEALPTLTEVRDEYFELPRTRHTKKTEQQLRRWKNPRARAVSSFLEIVAPKDGRGNAVPTPIDQITREDALKFREWWACRVQDGMDPGTANKDFGHLSEMWYTWTALKEVEISNPFKKLRFEVRGKNKTKTPAFSPEWVKDKLLAPGALDGINDEARDVFLMMINTGLRPSEITDAPLEDYVLNQSIPFLRVAENGRELKVEHTERDIPLVGVSLEAAHRIVARGGIQRYRHKANS